MDKAKVKTVLQIESLEADELLTRLERMESAITALSSSPQSPATDTTRSEYTTRREVAKILKVSIATVDNWTKKGILQSYKIDYRTYYKRSEVENALIKKGGLHGKLV